MAREDLPKRYRLRAAAGLVLDIPRYRNHYDARRALRLIEGI
jgi:hypothetical protein